MTETFTKEDAKTSAYIFHGHMCFYPEFKRKERLYFWHRMCYTFKHIKMSLNSNHSLLVPLAR